MNNLVSIVMPVYNGEQYIEEAINSVLSQTYVYWELVVIDDGSVDKTADIIANFNDERIRYFFQKNRGQTAALNHGLEIIQGEYFTSLDADDCFPVDSLLVRVTYLDNHPDYGAVYADGYFCDENLEPITRFSNWRIQNSTGDVYGDFIGESLCTGSGTVMIRRDVIRKYQLRYDESIVWCQDLDFYIRVAEKCLFGEVDYVAHLYRVHDNNMTVSMSSGRRLESLIRTKFKVLGSNKLTSVPIWKKYEYFRKFFVKDLHNHPDDQVQVLNNHHFLELPKHLQAQLLRYAAIKYLLETENTAIAEKYLKMSHMNNPFDLKTRFLVLLFSIHPDFVKWILMTRNMISPTKEYSPFIKS